MIDWERVNILKTELDMEDLTEIIDLFLAEIEAEIRALESNFQTPATLAAQLHAVKGATSNLGFSELASICSASEAAIGQGRFDLVDLSSISRTFVLSKQAFFNGQPKGKP